MKIAASDFDCTLLFPRQRFPDKNGIAAGDIAAVDKWRAAGHVFGIVTGRNYQMLVRDTQRYGLSFDFAVCLTGAAVYGAETDAVKQSPLDNSVSRAVIALPALRGSRHIACFTAYGIYVCIQSEKSWFKTASDLNEFTQIDFFTAQCLKGICQISLQYENAEQAAAAAGQINDLHMGAAAYRNINAIDIVGENVSKADGLKAVLSINGWQGSEVLAIGDSLNDLPLIREFNGFAVGSADEEVKRCAAGIYDSVAGMLLSNIQE